MITQKDFEAFAEAFVNGRRDKMNGLEIYLVQKFKQLNTRFDETKFFNRVAELENQRKAIFGD
jgi:hypothetical protein